MNHSRQNEFQTSTLPETSAHRTQSFWQIAVPLGLSVAVMLVLLALVIFSSSGGNVGLSQRWANISMVWMILPLMLAGILLLAVNAALIFLLAKLLNILPFYTQEVKLFFKKVSTFVKEKSDLAAAPVFTVQSEKAKFTTLLQRLHLYRPEKKL